MISYTPPDLKDAVEEAFKNLAGGEPMSSIDSNLTDEQLNPLLAEAQGLPKAFFRQIDDGDSPWVNSTRATLFPKSNAIWPLGLVGKMALPRSEKWAPSISRFCSFAAATVRAASIKGALPRDIDSLNCWNPNRVGINFMNGSPWDPASIGEHTDPPEETGLVMALELLGNSAGRLSFIFSADASKILGLDQPPHSLYSEEPRISITLAELQSEAPFGL